MASPLLPASIAEPHSVSGHVVNTAPVVSSARVTWAPGLTYSPTRPANWRRAVGSPPTSRGVRSARLGRVSPGSGRWSCESDSACAAGLADDGALRLQLPQLVVHRRPRLQADPVGDLPHRRRLAILRDRLPDARQDPLLHAREVLDLAPDHTPSRNPVRILVQAGN